MLALIMVLCIIPGVAMAAEVIDTWDGTVDTSWYNDTDTEFTLTTAEQLAGLAKLVDDGNTFAGKTIKLGACLDLNKTIFEPIGDASSADFSGTFDGDNHIISNLRQDCNSKHLALFGAVYEGTVKNLVLDNALIENDGSGYAGGIAAYAGAANFENITLRNSTIVNYNHNTGGIVAWCSNNGTTTTFDGINIESSTTIGSWWGSYDTRVGGIVGAMNTGNYVVIKNSKVACKLDVYNDVCSNYQWYNYRTAGMVVADVRDNQTVDGRTQANPSRVTCENVEVIFGDWANYHYCESSSYGTPSYADEGEYKFKRVEAGLGYGGVDLSACNHADDETHNELIAFDFLFGARDGKGIYGISSFTGVTVKYETPASDPAPAPKPSRSGISITYNGGNSFSTSKSAVPTSVEIDGVEVPFTGNGSSFTVGCIDPNAEWVTVRWNSTSVTVNFKPDASVVCAEVMIPKTGDMPFWAAVAQFFSF